MKVIVIGDPHFKTVDIDECQEMADAILDQTSKASPDFIVVLGDTLDRFESIHVSPLRQATEWLFNLTKIAPVYLLIGNHDRPNPKSYKDNDHPFNALKLWDRMTVVESVIRVEMDDCVFIFAPYYYNGMFAEKVAPLLQGPVTCIFSHQEFRGVSMGGPSVSTSTDVVIPEYNLVVNGHIHEYQELERLICVGTPRQIAFNESFPKTISLFDFNGMKWKQERLILNITKKLTLRVSTKELQQFNPPEKSKIKLIVDGTLEEIKSTMKTYKNKYTNVKIAYNVIEETSQSVQPQMVVKRSFKEHLLEAIKGTEAEEIFNEVFSG